MLGWGKSAGGGIKRAQGRLKRPCKRFSTPVFAIGGKNALIRRFLSRVSKNTRPHCVLKIILIDYTAFFLGIADMSGFACVKRL